MKTIPLHNQAGDVVDYAKVDDEDYLSLARYSWHRHAGGYASRGDYSTGRLKIITMHRQLMGFPLGQFVDHVNHDKLDNRRKNLRVCSRRDNFLNGTGHRNRRSKYKGVSWSKVGKKWVAQIGYNGRQWHLGYFAREEDAALAYDKRAKELHGEFYYNPSIAQIRERGVPATPDH